MVLKSGCTDQLFAVPEVMERTEGWWRGRLSPYLSSSTESAEATPASEKTIPKYQ